MQLEDELLRNLSHMYRFHRIPVVKSQSVAEHQYHVQMIALDLMVRLWKSNELLPYIAEEIAISQDTKESLALCIMLKAAYHDTYELIMGDIPYPVKLFNRPFFNSVEEWAQDQMRELHVGDVLENFGFSSSIEETAGRLVKLADMLDVIFYLFDEFVLGNRTAALGEIIVRARESLEGSKLYETTVVKELLESIDRRIAILFKSTGLQEFNWNPDLYIPEIERAKA